MATVQPQTPLMQAELVLWAEQLVHSPPPVPHAAAARPLAQDPPEQHPPWQGWLALHEVVQTEPLQAYPVGQSPVAWQCVVHTPPTQVWLTPHTCPTPQPPQLFGSLLSSTQAPLQDV